MLKSRFTTLVFGILIGVIFTVSVIGFAVLNVGTQEFTCVYVASYVADTESVRLVPTKAYYLRLFPLVNTGARCDVVMDDYLLVQIAAPWESYRDAFPTPNYQIPTFPNGPAE